MRNFTVIATAFAASAVLFVMSPAVPAQTWVETHPILIDAISRADNPDVRAETKMAPVQEARLRPDATPEPDDAVKADKGPLDHPANASGESTRHE